MDTRREFLKKAALLSGGSSLVHVLPLSIAKALAIDPAAGSTYLDAEHVVFLMQENRSFDHAYGTLQGVRGFNDPRAINLPDKNLVWLQSNNQGQTYCPFHLDIKNTKATWMNSLPHSWANQVDARNEGRYDKWLESKRSGKDEYKEMPLTLGYHRREDIPFYYALADAFTICDQNFCSSLTGTTPNRLFFWTGTIRQKPDENSLANVWNEDADYDTMVSWPTFPETLEQNGISWKVYQNELSVGVGFEEHQDSWLANFGDNPLEYFTQYHVKFHQAYIDNLPKAIVFYSEEIEKRQEQLKVLSPDSEDAKKIKKEVERLYKRLAISKSDQKEYTTEKYEQLSPHEKNLHQKALSTNKKDPHYHQLTALKYKDGSTQREMMVPKGDVLYQFREDVKNGKLPTVSWIVAPENFSDHPASAWYGVWYISEVMDILTQNPEIWKKTIFILTYDENDGYFDHVPPFVAPHPYKTNTGLTSEGINTAVDYVANEQQQSIAKHARESSIGLGYRVPMVIASPWSRGGWVNSEIFDHSSSLQFLENFLLHKTAKNIQQSNISNWRRTVCGDLTSAFRPYNGEKITLPEFLQRDEFVESIHKAQFKKLPSNYRNLSPAEIALINKNPYASPLMPKQEKGIRASCALPYELYADGKLNGDKKAFEIVLKAGSDVFGDVSAGSPFHIYAPGIYRQQVVKTWAYAVQKGHQIVDKWTISDFENDMYHLRVYGPNGFYREFLGNDDDPDIEVSCLYHASSKNTRQLSGNLIFQFDVNDNKSYKIEITDNAYNTALRHITLTPSSQKQNMVLPLEKSYGWYDFSLRVNNSQLFEKRYAGRVETGKHGKTDPFMGRIV